MQKAVKHWRYQIIYQNKNISFSFKFTGGDPFVNKLRKLNNRKICQECDTPTNITIL